MSSFCKSLKGVPFKTNECNLHVLNEDELLLVASVNPRFKTVDDTDSLWKYSIKKNEWTEWCSYPSHLHCGYHTSSIDYDSCKLYMFGDPGEVITLDLNTGEFTGSPIIYDGAHARSLCIDGKFHVFGGWQQENKAHFVWNEQTQTMEKIKQLEVIDTVNKLTCHSLVYMASRQCILIIPYTGNAMYLYSLQMHECEKIVVQTTELGNFMHEFQKAAITKDERYAVCVMTSGKLSVMRLDTFEVAWSTVEFPSMVYVVCIQSDIQTEILVFGYIRTCYQSLPSDLCNMIARYIAFDVMYALGRGKGETGSAHYALRIDDIIANTPGLI